MVKELSLNIEGLIKAYNTVLNDAVSKANNLCITNQSSIQSTVNALTKATNDVHPILEEILLVLNQIWSRQNSNDLLEKQVLSKIDAELTR
jgi:TRAP-type mannitol/chloroaromatic compound transport system substrate-binding protein